MDYTTLASGKTTSGSLANWTNRGDLPVTTILDEAQAWVYQRMRVREMQARSTLTFTTAGQTCALPARFLDPIFFKPYGGGDPLPFVHEEGLEDFRDETGALLSAEPSRWTIVGETAYVDSLPVETFAGVIMFYQQPAALAATSNETNFLTIRYPRLLRHACMGMAYEHMKDDTRTQEFLQLAELDLQEAMRTNDMWRRSQHVLRT